MQSAKKVVQQSAGTFAASSSAATTGESTTTARGALALVRDGNITIASLIDRYMSEYSGRDCSRVQRLGFWSDQLGNVTLTDLDDDGIFHAIETLTGTCGKYYAGKDADGRKIFKRKKGAMAPATRNRYLAALGAVLTWAVKKRVAHKGFVNPISRLERTPENNSIIRFLSDYERTALLSECRKSSWPKLYAFVLLGLTSGGRRGELEGLHWQDIDFERGQARVARTKNGESRVLILTASVVEELLRFRGADNALVFASSRRPDVVFNHVAAWHKALKNAGVKRFRFHDLRHSCASALAQSGATLLQIATVLGHKNTAITMRYAHLATSHSAELINRVLGGFR